MRDFSRGESRVQLLEEKISQLKDCNEYDSEDEDDDESSIGKEEDDDECDFGTEDDDYACEDDDNDDFGGAVKKQADAGISNVAAKIKVVITVFLICLSNYI